MAKDYSGREQGRRKDPVTGKPLKLMSRYTPISQEQWDRAFGKKPKKGKRNG